MDEHAALWANRLVGNLPEAPVIEFLLQGARLIVLREIWLAVTGADAFSTVSTWRPVQVEGGDVISFPHNRSGTWIYLAIAGGIAAERILGSASTYPRGRVGRMLAAGDLLFPAAETTFHLPEGVKPRPRWNAGTIRSRRPSASGLGPSLNSSLRRNAPVSLPNRGGSAVRAIASDTGWRVTRWSRQKINSSVNPFVWERYKSRKAGSPSSPCAMGRRWAAMQSWVWSSPPSLPGWRNVVPARKSASS
jgi:Carboxyltransferase domain, subdomain A and B